MELFESCGMYAIKIVSFVSVEHHYDANGSWIFHELNVIMGKERNGKGVKKERQTGKRQRYEKNYHLLGGDKL